MTHPLPPLVAERLRALRERPAEPTDKGFGYPMLTLRESALAGNLAAMAAYCAGAGVELAPHGKTAMSPELAARQLASGAWGITVATIGQLRMYRAFGFPRLLLANELVDEPGIAWLAGELAADPGFAAYCYVDSTDGVAILDRVLMAHPAGRRLPVLVEIGLGRTGCRTDEQALTVAKAAAATSTLTVAGVAGYEGTIGGTPAQPLDLVTSFCRRLANLAGVVAEVTGAHGEFIVTAGGSVSFDVVARELTAGGNPGRDDRGPAQRLLPLPRSRDLPGRLARCPRRGRGARVPAGPGAVGAGGVAARAGAGTAQRGPPRRRLRRGPAGAVAGAPPGRGRGLADAEVTGLNDQHAYLRLDPGTALAPGDVVCLGISHPCTTLDKWRLITVLDDEDNVIDAVHTFF